MKCILRYWAITDLTFGDLSSQSHAQVYNSDYFMKRTVAPSNLYVSVLIGVGAYSNPSKFQKDSIYKSWDMPLKNHGFPTVYIRVNI